MNDGNVSHFVVTMLEDFVTKVANLFTLLVAFVALVTFQATLVRVDFATFGTRVTGYHNIYKKKKTLVLFGVCECFQVVE